MIRYVLLDALRDGPKHGYEIIKWLDERTGGAYAPSPGAVYPTLQLLGDLGFVRAEQEEDRRVYTLTETGQSALDEHAEAMQHFWGRFTGATDPHMSRPEFGFVQDELRELTRTVWVAVQAAMARDDRAATGEVRSAVERCKNEVRDIIARGATAAATTSASADPRTANNEGEH
jgi:DNA-binding PadR family transcriptional regulator